MLLKFNLSQISNKICALIKRSKTHAHCTHLNKQYTCITTCTQCLNKIYTWTSALVYYIFMYQHATSHINSFILTYLFIIYIINLKCNWSIDILRNWIPHLYTKNVRNFNNNTLKLSALYVYFSKKFFFFFKYLRHEQNHCNNIVPKLRNLIVRVRKFLKFSIGNKAMNFMPDPLRSYTVARQHIDHILAYTIQIIATNF